MTLTLNRRSLLTTLGKAFGAGGLILSSGRAGALALPANLDAAASLPLTTATLPVSPELVHWRGLVDELHAFRLQTRGRRTLAPALAARGRGPAEGADVSGFCAAAQFRTPQVNPCSGFENFPNFGLTQRPVSLIYPAICCAARVLPLAPPRPLPPARFTPSTISP